MSAIEELEREMQVDKRRFNRFIYLFCAGLAAFMCLLAWVITEYKNANAEYLHKPEAAEVVLASDTIEIKAGAIISISPDCLKWRHRKVSDGWFRSHWADTCVCGWRQATPTYD